MKKGTIAFVLVFAGVASMMIDGCVGSDTDMDTPYTLIERAEKQPYSYVLDLQAVQSLGLDECVVEEHVDDILWEHLGPGCQKTKHGHFTLYQWNKRIPDLGDMIIIESDNRSYCLVDFGSLFSVVTTE